MTTLNADVCCTAELFKLGKQTVMYYQNTYQTMVYNLGSTNGLMGDCVKL